MYFDHLLPFVWKLRKSRKKNRMPAEYSQITVPEFPNEDSSNGNGNMELHMQVDMPWKDGFQLGEGIDAITGETSGNPFQDITWSPSERKDKVSKSESKVVHHLHELHQDAHANANATINTNSSVTTVGANFDYLLSKERSSDSFIVKHEINGTYGFESPPQSIFKLKPEAQQCLNDSPAKFRQLYGDYFIYGFQRGYSFQALVVCSADKAKTTQTTEADAKANVTSLFATNAQANLKNIHTSDLAVESTYVTQRGCDLDIPADLAGGSNSDSTVSLQAAVQMARGIQTKDQPCVHIRVLLKHYRILYDQIPKEVPVTKNAFLAVRDLGNIVNWLELNVTHPSIPSTHRQKMATIIQRFWDQHPSLSGDKETRKLISEELKLALESTASIINNDERIQRGKQDQPKERIKTSLPDPSWEYGITPQVKDRDAKCQSVQGEEKVSQCFLLAPVKTNCPVKLHFTANSSRDSKEDKPSQFSFAGRAEIIGWSLSCNSEDGEVVSFTLGSGGGIGKSRLSITARAPKGREWRCRVFFRELESSM